MESIIILGEKTNYSSKLTERILTTLDKIEQEFQKILDEGLNEHSPIYLYFGDIRCAAKKLAEKCPQEMGQALMEKGLKQDEV